MLACLMVLTDSSLITLAESAPYAAEEEAAIAGVSGSDLPEAQVDAAETRVGTGDGGDVSGSDAVTIVHSGHVDNGTAQGVDWSIDSNGKLLVEGTGNFMQEEGNLVPVWSEEYREEIVSAVVNVTGADLACAMFEGCTNLQTVDLSGFDTGNVESMVLMFADCSSLKSLDLSSFDTSHVTDMSDMFSGCEMLESINLSGFETSQVGEMRSMFAGCAKLQTIDVSGFNTSGVSSVSEMFLGCKSLKEIDLSNFDVTYCENFYNMFKGCTALETIHTIKNLGESVALPVPMMDAEGTTYYEMPLEEEESILLKRLNPDNAEQWLPVEGQIDNETDHITWKITVVDGEILLTVTGTGNCFNEDEQVDWNTYMPLIQAAKLDVKSMTDATRLFRNAVSLKRVDLSNWDTSNVTSVEGMFINCTSLEEIVFADHDTSKVTTTENMFSGCESLQTLDLSWMDTSAVEYMNGMFKGCSSLRSLDVSGFDMRQVYDVGDMFKNCTAIEEINTFKTEVSDSIREHVQWGEYQFSLPVAPMYDADGKEYTEFTEDFPTSTWLYASKEQVPIARGVVNQVEWSISQSGHLVISGEGEFKDAKGRIPWNADEYGYADQIITAEVNLKDVKDASNMFSDCVNLTNIDLCHFDTSQVTDMRWMFSGCKKLETLDLSHFDTSQVTDMGGMFEFCEKLKSLDFSSFDTSNVTGMYYMFAHCYSLEALDLSQFDTSHVTEMHGMFWCCTGLEQIDLSSFDTSCVMHMEKMFYQCCSLTNLDLSSFDTGHITCAEEMFDGCIKLRELDISSFDLSNATIKKHETIEMFDDCFELETLKTFKNNQYLVKLPVAMVDAAGELYVEIPAGNAESIVLKRPDDEGFEKLLPIEEHLDNDTDQGIDWSINKIDGEVTLSIEGTGDLSGVEAYMPFIESAEVALTETTNASGMFYNARKLRKINLEKFDTSNIENMSSMFAYCSSLESIDLSRFHIGPVESMESMFAYCSSLKSLDVSGFNTSGVVTMAGMFRGCSNLKELNLSNFNTKSVIKMNSMFYGCEKLETLDLSSFDMSKVYRSIYMFDGCTSIKALRTFMVNFDRDVHEDAYISLPVAALYDAAGNAYTEITADFPTDTWLYSSKDYIQPVLASGTINEVRWCIYENGKLEIRGFGDFKDADGNIPWSAYADRVTTAEICLEGNPEGARMFAGFSNLISVDFSHSSIGVLDYTYRMFSGCSQLQTIDWGGIDSIELYTSMFSGCSSLKCLDLSKFYVEFYSGEWGMPDVFFGCTSLTKVRTMKNLKWELLPLPTIPMRDEEGNYYVTFPYHKEESIWLEKTDIQDVLPITKHIDNGTEKGIDWKIDSVDGEILLTVDGTGNCNVTDPETPEWFAYASEIEAAEIHLSETTDACCMFKQHNKLRRVDLSDFDGSKVNDFYEMFINCTNLEQVNFGKIDTSSATDMRKMFWKCGSLKCLDISEFDMQKVDAASEMFGYCPALEKLHLPKTSLAGGCVIELPVSPMYDYAGNEYAEFSEEIPDSIWLYASKDLIPIDCTLTYDVNGGDELEQAAKIVVKFDAYGDLATPTRTGYTFLGWFTAAEGGEQVTAETICAGDATIYAHWSPIAYKLTYDVNGGDPLESTETEKTITYGSAYGDLVTPTRTGHTFLGWFTAAEDGEQVTAETICTGDATIYGHWSPIACKLTYDVNGGDPLETAAAEKTITYGSAYGDLVTPTRTGYTFLGWFTAAEGGEQVTAETICTGDATIYAHWSKIENHDGFQLKLADEDAIYTYTGTQIKPAILVTNDGEPLQEGIDYTVKYSNNINAADATSNQKQPTITVTGKGNLTGSVTISFTIERKDIDDPDVVKGDVVTDNVDKAVPTLFFHGVALKANKDFTSKYHADDSTKGTFVIEGIGNYTGTTSIAVTVKEKKELKKFTVKLAPTDQSALVYDGTPKMPSVIVTDAKSKLDLTVDEDYTVIYADNVNAGSAKVMVVGKGDYAGIITKKFTIKPQKANITVQNTNPDAAKGYPYASAGVTIADDLAVYAAKQGASAAENVLLTQGKDYKIAFSANKKAGTAKYTITFLGNYKGTKAVKGSFTIVPAGLSELYRAGEAQIMIGDKAYTGKAGTYVSAPIIRIGDTLLKKSDYTCTYYADEGLQNPVGKGNLISLTDDQPYATVYVKIFGKGNYAENAAAGNTTDGYLVLTYQVRKATYDLSKAKVTVVDANQKKLSRVEYTGQAIEPAVVVTIGSGKNMVTVPADQYVVTYAGNVNKGKATVIVNGTSDACVGSKTATFTIVSGKLVSLLHK